MFNKKFALESAYFSGGKTVMNYFTFFVMALGIGAFASGLFLLSLGIIDFFVLKRSFMDLIKVFEQAMNSSTGTLHHSVFSVDGSIKSFLPKELLQYFMDMDMQSIDISKENIHYIVSWLIPTALALKLFADMISIGWIKIALDLNVNKEVHVSYLFKYFYLVPRVLIADLIVGIITIFASLLFLVPGIFLYQRLRFARFFIIDKNLSILESLKASWIVTESAVLQLTGFSIISLILDRVSDILVVFKLFTIPLQNQTKTNIYQQLSR